MSIVEQRSSRPTTGEPSHSDLRWRATAVVAAAVSVVSVVMLMSGYGS
jgi:hypothetical protein